MKNIISVIYHFNVDLHILMEIFSKIHLDNRVKLFLSTIVLSLTQTTAFHEVWALAPCK